MIKKWALFFLKALMALGCFVGLQQLIELKTCGFCLEKIQADDLSHKRAWETAPLSLSEQNEVNALLAQPYTLLGSGSECFAFASADGTAVIKFFKLDFARPVYFKKGLFLEDHSTLAGTLSDHPLTRMNSRILKRLLGIREFRIQRTFSSIKLAYDELREETGLVYLHLNPTPNRHMPLTIIDGSGIQHQIDLNTTRFFLQKRAVPLEKHLSALKKQQAHENAQKSIDSLLDLFLRRCKKGYADRDILNRNLGFIGTQAVEIDSGSFLKDPRMKEAWIYKQELFYATLELKEWLKENYPEMVSYLDNKVMWHLQNS